MEDAVATVPRFLKIPVQMLTGDKMTKSLSHLTSHFFGDYDGHGGSQVANYCSGRVHTALQQELEPLMAGGGGDENSCQDLWKKAFIRCFLRVDDEIGGKQGNLEIISPEMVGSTAPVKRKLGTDYNGVSSNDWGNIGYTTTANSPIPGN
ncbi:hypothetical protein LXL04_034043 [Taraxacum kok-saghyz]